MAAAAGGISVLFHFTGPGRRKSIIFDALGRRFPGGSHAGNIVTGPRGVSIMDLARDRGPEAGVQERAGPPCRAGSTGVFAAKGTSSNCVTLAGTAAGPIAGSQMQRKLDSAVAPTKA